MENELQYQVEELIDKNGLANVLSAIWETCTLKDAHIVENWQDEQTAKLWRRMATAIAHVETKAKSLGI